MLKHLLLLIFLNVFKKSSENLLKLDFIAVKTTNPFKVAFIWEIYWFKCLIKKKIFKREHDTIALLKLSLEFKF